MKTKSWKAMQVLIFTTLMMKAGEGIRTLDVQLGKLAFYH